MNVHWDSPNQVGQSTIISCPRLPHKLQATWAPNLALQMLAKYPQGAPSPALSSEDFSGVE